MIIDIGSPFVVIAGVLLALGWARCRKGNDLVVLLFSIVCILDMNMISAPLAVVNGQEISCSDVALVLFFIFAFALAVKNRALISRRMLVSALAISTILLLSLLVNFFHPYEGSIVASGVSWDLFVQGMVLQSDQEIGGRNLFVFLRYVLFVFSGVLTVSLFGGNDFIRVGRYILIAGKIHIGYAVFELGMKVLFESSIASQFTSFLFADSHIYTSYFQRESLVALWGITREPPHFVLALGWFVIVFTLLKMTGNASRDKIAWPIMAIVLMCLSAASSIVVLLPALVFFILAINQIRRDGRVHLLSAAVGILILFAGFYFVAEAGIVQALPYFGKATGVLESLGDAFRGNYFALRTVEGSPRLISVVESIRVWMDVPLCGIGVGSMNPFSGVFAQLVNTGILGFCSWLVYLRSLQGKNPAKYSYLLLMFVVIGMTAFLGQEGSMYSFSFLLVAPLISYCLGSLSVEDRISGIEFSRRDDPRLLGVHKRKTKSHSKWYLAEGVS